MPSDKQDILTIFFDGNCSLCRRFVKDCQTKDRHQRLLFLDGAEAGVSLKEHNIDPEAFRHSVQAKDSRGKLYEGADCLAQIWSRLPGYRLRARIFQIPVFRPIFRISYRVFVSLITPYFRKNSCSSGCDFRKN